MTIHQPEAPFHNVPDQAMDHVRKPLDRVRVRTVLDGTSMTDTSQLGETDINEIVRKYRRSGTLPPPPEAQQYGDVSDLQQPADELYALLGDVQARLDALSLAQEAEQSGGVAQPSEVAQNPATGTDTRNEEKSE